MKKPICYFSLLILLVLCTLGIGSCKKSGDEDGAITWTYQGKNYSASYIYITSADAVGGNFLAGLGRELPPNSGFIGKISPLEVGTYPVLPRNQNKNWLTLRFLWPPGLGGECVGSITITSVNNNRLSANFNLTTNNAAAEKIVGSISNILITR